MPLFEIAIITTPVDDHDEERILLEPTAVAAPDIDLAKVKAAAQYASLINDHGAGNIQMLARDFLDPHDD